MRSPRKTKRRAASPDLCEVARLGLELQRLQKQDDAVHDLRCQQSGGVKAVCEAVEGAIGDQRFFIQRKISFLEARTLPGAMVQTIIAQELVEELRDETEEFERKRLIERLTACHYSITHVLETATGLSAEAFAASYYMPDYLNPHGKGIDHLARCKKNIATLR